MDGLSVGVLGPVAATRDGHDVPLGGPRRRAVLAALVAARPEALTAERLAAAVWADDAAVTPNALQFHVSRLRATLGPAVVVRSGAGYRVALDPSAVDAEVFVQRCRAGRRHLDAGRPGDAAGELDAALELWRGTPYGGVGDLPFAVPEATRLGELRLAAVEDRLRAWAALGRHGEVAAAARAHTAEHPWREVGWALLAAALAAQGRRSDALAALRSVRRVLADELGLDPGRELVAVERAVLAGHPPAAPRPVVEPALPPLPVPVTSLVGRDALLERLGAVLDGPDRLVTLTGPGGVGKTRVALEAARRHLLPALLVELGAVAPGTDPASMIAQQAGAAGTAEGLAAWLAGRELLVVLDNAEHLVDAVAALVPRLLTAPGVRVLLTSRESLDVPGEVVVEVPPLAPADAAALFSARAAAVRSGAGPIDAGAVAVVCGELDRLPLALELAAARLRVLSLDELVAGLAHRFELLDDGLRGAPPHQRGLLGTVAWSADAASPGERELLEALAVFPDGFDLASADAVVSEYARATSATTTSRLAGLVRRSLVTAVPDTAPRRFRLLVTVREYTRDRTPPDRRRALAAAHRRSVAARTRDLARRLHGPGSTDAFARLRQDRADHRAALASARADGDTLALLALAGDLNWFWYRGAAVADGLAWTRAALDLAPPGSPPGPVGRAWFGLGRLLYLSGDAAGARDAFTAAGEPARAADDPTLRALVAAWGAHVTALVDGPTAGVPAAAAAVDLAAGAADHVLAEATMVLGMAQRLARDPAARTTLRRAVAVARGAGYRWAAVSSSWALMKAARDAGDLREALDAAAEMAGPLADEGDASSWLVLLHTTAAVLADAGRPVDAARLHAAVTRHTADTGFRPERMDPVDGPGEAEAITRALRIVGPQPDPLAGVSYQEAGTVLAALVRGVPPKPLEG